MWIVLGEEGLCRPILCKRSKALCVRCVAERAGDLVGSGWDKLAGTIRTETGGSRRWAAATCVVCQVEGLPPVSSEEEDSVKKRLPLPGRSK